ncbi:MAG: DUF5698 domain-containing protein [Anaerolineales bacterium]
MAMELVTGNIWIDASIILGLRVINMAMDTLRLRMMSRGQKVWTFIFGVIETLIYIYTLSSVIQNLDNWVNITAYSLGFGIGSLVGMAIDERRTHVQVLPAQHVDRQVVSDGCAQNAVKPGIPWLSPRFPGHHDPDSDCTWRKNDEAPRCACLGCC